MEKQKSLDINMFSKKEFIFFYFQVFRKRKKLYLVFEFMDHTILGKFLGAELLYDLLVPSKITHSSKTTKEIFAKKFGYSRFHLFYIS